MKRKTLAILLSVLLVVSAVLVLAACSKEYTITFRDAGIKKDEQTTVKGKVEYKGDEMKADDRIFEGWYDAATGGNKIDLETAVFDKDTTLHAHWTMIGESKGYCLPGVINGVQYMGEEEKDMWDTKNAAEEPTRKLTHESATSNVYTIELTLKAADSFKLITAYGESNSWNKGKIQVGGKETTVKLAEGVTLPEDLTVDDLFSLSNSDNNIMPQIDMTATLKFVYNGNSDNSTIEITVKSVTGSALEAPNKVGFFVAGAFNNFYDKGTVPATGDANSKYVMTADATNNLFTIEGLEIKQGQDFKVKINETGWRKQYGYAAFTFSLADDATVTGEAGGKTMADVFVQGSNEDSNKNVVVKYNVTVEMELDYSAGIISVTVTAIDWTEQKPDSELGYFVVCTPNNFYSAGTVDKTDATNGKYVMSVDAANDKLFTAENIQLTANQTFRVKLNISGWTCPQYNYTHAEFVLGTGVTLPEGIESVESMFKGEDNSDHNIVIKGANLKFNLSLDTSKTEKQLTVTVTEIVKAAEEKPVTEIGCLIVGDHNGWALYNSPVNVLAYDETSGTYKITGVQIGQDKNFQLKVNDNDNWSRGQFGRGCVRNVTFAASLTDLPAGIDRDNAIAVIGGDATNKKGNISPKNAVTINVTLDYETGEIDIEITAIEARNEAAPEAGFSIAGSINGWGSETPKIAMTENEDKTVFTKEGLVLEVGSQFKIKNGETGNWTPEFGAAAVKSITLAQGLELPADKTNVNELFNLTAANIEAETAMTITVTLDWTTKAISIIVTAFPAAE